MTTTEELPRPGSALSMQELADLTGLSYVAIAKGVRNGEIPAHKIGGAKIIYWGEFMEQTRIKPKWERQRRTA